MNFDYSPDNIPLDFEQDIYQHLQISLSSEGIAVCLGQHQDQTFADSLKIGVLHQISQGGELIPRPLKRGSHSYRVLLG